MYRLYKLWYYFSIKNFIRWFERIRSFLGLDFYYYYYYFILQKSYTYRRCVDITVSIITIVLIILKFVNRMLLFFFARI